jgi:PDZ domain-containing secreted protein
LDGKVGAVGAVRQKVLGARRERADLFLVPRAELSDACSRAGDMRVIGVDHLRDAVRALRDPRFADERSCE